MESRECTVVDATFGPQYQVSELDSDTTVSTTYTSVTSTESMELTIAENHVPGCSFSFTKICVCRALTRRRMKEQKRLAEQNSSLSSTILAGNVGVMSSSYTSSDTYHSAQTSAIEEDDDGLEVTYSNMERSTIAPETSKSRLNTAVIEPRRRDTNHNINSAPKLQQNAEKNADPISESVINDESSYMQPFLEKLVREIEAPPDSHDEPSKPLAKRLSAHFLKDPDGFKEKLLTIIEESDLTADLQAKLDQKSAINLSRLTTEFKRACKFLGRESMIARESILAEEAIADCTAPSFMFHTSFADITLQHNEHMSNQSPPIFQKRRSSVGFQTPTRKDPYKQLKVYPKTPRTGGGNVNCSPLRVAALKKASGSPVSVKTPNDVTPNDSFTYWETLAEQIATPENEVTKKKLRRSMSMPNLDAQLKIQEIKQKADLQLQSLEESPVKTDNFQDSLTPTDYDTFNSHQSPNYDFSDSILEEVMKKRARCCETERTLREIEANSTSICSEDEKHLLEYFEQFIGDAGDYHKYLVSNKDKICDEIEKKLTPKVKRQAAPKTPRNPLKSSLRNQKMDRSAKKVQPAVLKTPNHLKRPSFIVNIRKRSPAGVKSSGLMAKSPVHQRSNNSSGYLSTKKMSSRSTSPAARTPGSSGNVGRRLAVARSVPNLAMTPKTSSWTISGVKTPSRLFDSQKPSSAGKTPAKPLSSSKTPSKMTLLSNKSSVKSSNYLSSARTPSKVPPVQKTPLKVTSHVKTPSKVKTPSRVTSAPKTPSMTYRTPSKFLKTRSPAKLSVSSRSSTESRSNSSSKILRTPRLVLTNSIRVPSLKVTPATPVHVQKSASTSKKSSLTAKKSPVTLKKSSLTSKRSPLTGKKSSLTSKKSPLAAKKLTSSSKKSEKMEVQSSTAEKSPEKRKIVYETSVPKPPAESEKQAKFFPYTPGATTRKAGGYLKKGKFFNTPTKNDQDSPKSMVFPRSAVYFGFSTVKSPVAEYIRSTDPQLAQKGGAGEKGLLLMQKKSGREVVNRNKDSNELSSASDEDTENIPNRQSVSHFPKTKYQPPSSVFDISCTPQSPGGRKHILREINDRRVMTRHESRVENSSADESIHSTKPAGKNYYAC